MALVLVTVVFLTAVACFLFGHKPRQPDPVSLVFQRYSDLDPYVGDAAFLLLTNASGNNYLLTMTDGTNTLVLDTFFGHFRQSLMVNCEFSDEIPGGRTNWIQTPSPFRGSNAYASLGPHSGLVIRVPLSADGQRRKVAALYEGPYIKPPAFWLTPTGLRVLRILPHAIRERVLPSPTLRKVWCDRELSYPTEKLTQK